MKYELFIIILTLVETPIIPCCFFKKKKTSFVLKKEREERDEREERERSLQTEKKKQELSLKRNINPDK